MRTLGIETSCDETSCAVLEGDSQVRSNIVSSSLFRHRDFGGVVPEIASRHCLEQIDFVYHQALKQARLRPQDIDLIAVTQGPGLIGSLLVGVSFAKALSLALGRPLIGVNHLEAHLMANFIGRKEPSRYVGLLVSGGHTSLSYHEKGKAMLLGETVDDAVGEAFDKVAKLLGLGYPGGPLIEKLAREGAPHAFHFTRPRQKNPLDFSFSGIKTAVLYEIQKRIAPHQPGKPGTTVGGSIRRASTGRNASMGLERLTPTLKADLCASFQQAVVDWLVEKTMAASKQMRTEVVVVGGGVSANSFLRDRLIEAGKKQGIEVWFPPLMLTTDNAAMIARCGLDHYRRGQRSPWDLTADPNLGMGRN